MIRNENDRRYAAGVRVLLDWCDAHPGTHSATACARVLLATYDPTAHPLNLARLRDLDEPLRGAALEVVRGYALTGRESHSYGEEDRIIALAERMREREAGG